MKGIPIKVIVKKEARKFIRIKLDVAMAVTSLPATAVMEQPKPETLFVTGLNNSSGYAPITRQRHSAAINHISLSGC